MSTRFLVAIGLVFSISLAAVSWYAGSVFSTKTQTQASNGSASSSTDSPCPGGAAPLYWKAPMDPTFMRDGPGKSPMGMDLVPQCPSGSTESRGGEVLIDPHALLARW